MLNKGNIRTPKVSICIPAYNAPDFFERVIKSVVSQDFSDYEIIVTDDSTDDRIRDILTELPISSPLTYVKNSPGLGAPANWNLAISLAKGEYIKIMHHDDWFLAPSSLSRFVALMEDTPEASLGFSAAENYDQNNNLKFVHAPSVDWVTALNEDHNLLFFGNLIGPPSAIIYKNAPGFLFDERLHWVVDIDFFIQLLTKGTSIVYTSDPLIGVTNDAGHQVTRACENNKQVEIFEYLCLYEKLANKRYNIKNYMMFFLNLFRKFSVTSIQELSLLTPGIAVPWHIKILITLAKHRLF